MQQDQSASRWGTFQYRTWSRRSVHAAWRALSLSIASYVFSCIIIHQASAQDPYKGAVVERFPFTSVQAHHFNSMVDREINRSGDSTSLDHALTCQAAATRAERAWRLPAGLLAAIGMVESGRSASAGMGPVIWPWTINAEGHGIYLPNKSASIEMVLNLRSRGVKVIDVGCFQVDLFYHPDAFANLDAAFDPDKNAQAAAKILTRTRLDSTGWDGAIAAYHSSMPLIGAIYLQKVHVAWRLLPAWDQQRPAADFVMLLSAQARLVRVVTPMDPSPAPSLGLPRVIEGSPDRARSVVQWLHRPLQPLPMVLSPPGSRRRARVALR